VTTPECDAQADKFERLFNEYVARFGVEPEWNMTPIEKQISDMEEALRLNRPIPDDDLPDGVLI